MDVRFQLSAAYDLNACTGCSTCSVACKELWTATKGTEHHWWNNLETKPGKGYPADWEDQNRFKGGWRKGRNGLELNSGGKIQTFLNLFHNPHMPGLGDYYEPWTYEGTDLVHLEHSSDQVTVSPKSVISGDEVSISAGPTWDDGFTGSSRDQSSDEAPSFSGPPPFFFHLPRICNHCLNPACVAACPSGALYKRGEDGVVLADQEKCRGWRTCITACPYKKLYFNWSVSKSEKCNACFPILESDHVPVCFDVCPSRASFLGLLFFDEDRLGEATTVDNADLVETFRSIILNPSESAVSAEAARSGIPDTMIDAARHSPVYELFVNWKLALPLFPEFRTLPAVFYIPPIATPAITTNDEQRTSLELLTGLFGAGLEREVGLSLERQRAVRVIRQRNSADGSKSTADQILREAGLTSEQAKRIHNLTVLAGKDERFVLPKGYWSAANSSSSRTKARSTAGFGFTVNPRESS